MLFSKITTEVCYFLFRLFLKQHNIVTDGIVTFSIKRGDERYIPFLLIKESDLGFSKLSVPSECRLVSELG